MTDPSYPAAEGFCIVLVAPCGAGRYGSGPPDGVKAGSPPPASRDEALLRHGRLRTARLAGLLHSRIRSLHSPGRIRAGRRRRRDHQAQALQQHDRPLCRCPPNELATFSLAVLHVDVSPGIFQAAILKGAVDEDPIIQDQVLVLEDRVLVSSHENTRLPPPGCGCKPGLNRGSTCSRVD